MSDTVAQSPHEEIESLRSLLELKRHTCRNLLTVQKRIAEVIGDIPSADHADFSLPGLVQLVIDQRVREAFQAGFCASLVVERDEHQTRSTLVGWSFDPTMSVAGDVEPSAWAAWQRVKQIPDAPTPEPVTL
jgi:hypothetical protein